MADIREEKPQGETQKKEESQRVDFFHRYGTPDDKLKLRNVLNCIFIALTVLTIILYFAVPARYGQLYFFITCFLAIAIKMIETAIRSSAKKRTKNHD